MTNTNQTSGLSDQQLKYAYWYIIHKKQLFQTITKILLILCATMLAYVIYGVSWYWLRGAADFDLGRLQNPNYIKWAAYYQNEKIRDLMIDDVKVFATGAKRVDIGVLVYNPNEEWGIKEIDYYFVLADGEKTPVQSSWFLPGEEKYLLALGIDTTSQSANLVLEKKEWQRQRKDRPFPEINLIVDNVVFKSARELGVSILRGGQAEWRITNKSVNNFWDIGFQVILLNGSQEVAFNYIQINEISSLSSKELMVSWAENLPSVSSVKIIPQVNLFDTKVLKE